MFYSLIPVPYTYAYYAASQLAALGAQLQQFMEEKRKAAEYLYEPEFAEELCMVKMNFCRYIVTALKFLWKLEAKNKSKRGGADVKL